MRLLYEGSESAVFLLEGTDERRQLRQLFGGVADELGWQPGTDFDGPCDLSHYLAIYCEGHLAGGIELRELDAVLHLPACATWPELRGEIGSYQAELIVLALTSEFRGKRQALWTLCTEMWRYCKTRGFEQLILVVPTPNLRVYNRLGWSLEVSGPERLHWGEPCLPCRLNVATVEAAMQSKARIAPSLRPLIDQAFRNS